MGEGIKVALGLDNARIHRANIVQALMASPEVAIKPVWNIAARPDLLTVGIEQVWARAKHLYRTAIDRYKAMNLQYNHMGFVQHILGQIDDDFARRVAAHSIPAVMNAQPVNLLPNEVFKGNPRDSWMHHSPNQRYLDYQSPDEYDQVEDEDVDQAIDETLELRAWGQ